MACLPWTELAERLARLEGESAMRRCLSDYMEICDRLDETTDLAALGALFTENAIWEGRGSRYAKDFGRRHGRSEIVSWLASYCGTPPHFRSNAHFLASEAIAFLPEERAQGRWMMLQTPEFHDGQSFLMTACLTIDFAVEAGRWRMAHFRTTNLYARRVSHWNEAVDLPVPTKLQHPEVRT